MVLEDFLFPGETIIFQSGKVKTLNDRFDFYITDQRMLLYKRRGFVLKKDRVIAERIEDIHMLAMKYYVYWCKKENKSLLGFTEEAKHALSRFNYKLNVRDVRTIIHLAVVHIYHAVPRWIIHPLNQQCLRFYLYKIRNGAGIDQVISG